MTDRYQEIRAALAMGPTPGPWVPKELPRDMQRDGYKFSISRGGLGWWIAKVTHGADGGSVAANAALIAACDPDTIRDLLAELDQLAAALEAARVDAARWRFVAQFMQLDNVGDDQYCLGLIVNYEALEDMVTAQSARLDGERRRLEWADVQGPEDSPKTLPPITLDAAIDAAIDQARGKGGQEDSND